MYTLAMNSISTNRLGVIAGDPLKTKLMTREDLAAHQVTDMGG